MPQSTNLFLGQKLLIVDDEAQERFRYAKIAKLIGFDVAEAGGQSDAFTIMEQQTFDFIICDLHLNSRANIDLPDGIELISQIRKRTPYAVILATSTDPRHDIWNKAMLAGANHFLSKPYKGSEELRIALEIARERRLIEKGFSPFFGENQITPGESSDGYVIDSDTRRIIQKLAKRNDVIINLTGETGTGKEIIVKLLHRERSAIYGPTPLTIVNCAQINPSIADSILFGHKKGSFTGASENSAGYIGDAHGGILFMDEIHSLDPQVQSKLLRVLNDGRYCRVGETKERIAQFYLITASTRDLDEECIAGRFLIDLRMRIDGYKINLPPLRERLDLLPDLIRACLKKQGTHLNESKIRETAKYLEQFNWPGNIRQLMKVLQNWCQHADIHEIPLSINNIPISKSMMSGSQQHSSLDGTDCGGVQQLTYALTHDVILEESINIIERLIISAAISRHPTLGAAANALGIPRSTFDAKRRKLGII